ncbi:hypothetical protein WICPIJ_002678 [Wickerhamomyces pijperi]|uniref:BZIP domain-containing protein n=1 Tax=Wickerhamomyces pijperi TaxID=599730 RepID=A0A9P8TPX4_WICPI|nr:hypothetical protein WICPIJ_002678 [Wickerhamomyces pijperi]
MSLNAINAVEYLNQADFSLPLGPSSNSVDGYLGDAAGLDQFMDPSFFDFDTLYNTSQFQTSDKASLQAEFQQQIGTIEDSSLVPEDFLSQFIKSESNEQDLSLKALPIAPKQAEVSPSSTTSSSSSPSTLSPDSEGVEMDKKKRNTAASARFRIKKKQREQEMERTLRSLTERVHKYNAQIQQLEFENKCLKSLIFEKNERKSDDLVRNIRQRSLGGSNATNF